MPPTNAAANREATNPQATALERDWRTWLTTLFPRHVGTDPDRFAAFHAEFWGWVWGLRRGERPAPFVAIWARGAGKSTAAELACAAVGALNLRRYALYVSSTQERADGHVQNVATMLETPAIERSYPALAARKVGKYGSSLGWRRNRIRTDSGFTLDAIGLDSAARGAKVDEDRPGLIIVDDVDDAADTPERVEKKITTLTRALFPAGAGDCAILAVQNLIHADSIFSRLADGRADFLADRHVSGPHPAIRDLTYEDRDGRTVLTGGTPTWAGQDLARCQEMVNDMGRVAFLAECQQAVSVLREHIWLAEWWDGRNRYDPANAPPVVARWLSVDSAYKNNASSDYTACMVVDLTEDYRLLVRHVWREKLLFPGLLARLASSVEEWYGAGLLREVLIEDRASGISAAQSLSGAGALRVPVKAFPVNRSKEERARQASLWASAGGILLPHPGPVVPWLFDFESELWAMPNGANDDMADTLSMAVLYLENFLARWRDARAGRAA